MTTGNTVFLQEVLAIGRKGIQECHDHPHLKGIWQLTKRKKLYMTGTVIIAFSWLIIEMSAIVNVQ